jgi:hypothetical protein
MKKVQLFLLSLAFVGVAANAASQSDVAPVLRSLDVNVQLTGEVLKTDRVHPYTYFLIGIPVSVFTGDACTQFVGQESTDERAGLKSIHAMGASDPINTACIDILPQPVKTTLTVQMKVLTGGFVPAQPIQTQIVQILPHGLYEIRLDLRNDSVTVRQLRALPR